ncbi:MAG TPA: hypothetical protein VN745_02315, partial [Verrucomicrobiae bacterium]|nr:hypothetical protein [Verrucomicrobiae bacterium]
PTAARKATSRSQYRCQNRRGSVLLHMPEKRRIRQLSERLGMLGEALESLHFPKANRKETAFFIIGLQHLACGPQTLRRDCTSQFGNYRAFRPCPTIGLREPNEQCQYFPKSAPTPIFLDFYFTFPYIGILGCKLSRIIRAADAHSRLGRLSHFMEVKRATFGTYENFNRGGYEKLELVENKGREAVLIAEISAIRLDGTNPNSIFGRLRPTGADLLACHSLALTQEALALTKERSVSRCRSRRRICWAF